MGRAESLPVRRALSWVLIVTLAFPVPLWGEIPSAPSTAAPLRDPVPLPSRFAVGPDYRLGPGDTVEVVIAGRVQVDRHVLIVTPEGRLHIPPIGMIPVAGLTAAEARRALAARAAPLFKFFDVSLTVLAARTFEVTVSGEVARPGTYAVTGADRLVEVINRAGGITPRGSVRRIELRHDGRVARTVDLLRFALRGEITENPYVPNGTSVFVPLRGPSVALRGAVARPGDYEIGEERTLAALLALTGGVPSLAALAEARLTRIGPDNRKETETLDLAQALAPDAPDIELQNGDVLFVPPIAVLQDVVEVRGAFLGTGAEAGATTVGKRTLVARIELASGDRVKDVIVKAGGIAPYADFRRAFVERGGITGPRQTVPVDLHRLLVERDDTQNVALQNGDVFVVPARDDKVYVTGWVRAPGGFDFRPFYSAKDYVLLAGGPDHRAKMRAATVTFPDGSVYKLGKAPPLEPGVVVQVPEVRVKWYEDYLLIASAVASIVTAYTGLFILFNGPIFVPAGERR